MTDRLDQLARRVADDPFFLAAPLAIYAAAEQLDDAALAAVLGCRTADLTMLRLCRSPLPAQGRNLGDGAANHGPLDPGPQPLAPRDASFRADVERIAARFGIDPHQLAKLLRHAEALSALRTQEILSQPRGLLMAARDRNERRGRHSWRPNGDTVASDQSEAESETEDRP